MATLTRLLGELNDPLVDASVNGRSSRYCGGDKAGCSHDVKRMLM